MCVCVSSYHKRKIVDSCSCCPCSLEVAAITGILTDIQRLFAHRTCQEIDLDTPTTRHYWILPTSRTFTGSSRRGNADC